MSGVRKRSVTIRGHRTSFSVEDPFHQELLRLAEASGKPLAALIAEVDAGRAEGSNLSSALRVFVLDALRRGG